MTSNICLQILAKTFPHEPTDIQQKAMQQLSTFLTDKDITQDYFILKGYAGTGKTTLIASLIKVIDILKKQVLLLAPTGRAAKVVSAYSGIKALTIHRQIYYSNRRNDGQLQFALKANKAKNHIYIVDEASMIADNPLESKLFENGSLLSDLIHYVRSGKDCKLIFVGDTAQLPPVHSMISPALDSALLEQRVLQKVPEIELDEVVRQGKNSGILYNATKLRRQMKNHQQLFDFKFDLSEYTDIHQVMDSYEIEDAICTAYDNVGVERSCIIVRSNKRANLYNKQIREKILGYDRTLQKNDYLMVVKNNYFWNTPQFKAGFIANGDIIKILKIYEFQDLYGFHFAKVQISMIDYPDQEPFDTVLLLDAIDADAPSLSYEQSQQLYEQVMQDYSSESSKYKRYMKVKKNTYFNSLQVKFAYAVTCHKAQGGQWHTILVEQPYLPNGLTDEDARWLYTALTRAEEQVYLVGFSQSFFE